MPSGRNPNAGTNSDAGGYTHSNGYCDRNGDAVAFTNPNGYCDRDSDPGADIHTDNDPNPNLRSNSSRDDQLVAPGRQWC